MHGDREYASLAGVESFYKQVLRDMIGKEDETMYGRPGLEYQATFCKQWRPFKETRFAYPMFVTYIRKRLFSVKLAIQGRRNTNDLPCRLLTPLGVMAEDANSLSVLQLLHISHSHYYLVDIDIQVNYRSILNIYMKLNLKGTVQTHFPS